MTISTDVLPRLRPVDTVSRSTVNLEANSPLTIGTKMSPPILSSTILKSLQLSDVHPDLPVALLIPDQTRARNRTEGKYWDYKESLHLNTRHEIAEFVRDVVAFHNTEGGMLAIGITNDYIARGITANEISDSAQLNNKLRSYLGPSVVVFSTSLSLPQNRYVWLIFVPRNSGSPRPILRNGPEIGRGKLLFVRGDFFYRSGDETKRCTNDLEINQLFNGLSTDSLTAYTYQVDEPYFRLLSPNYESFFGREALVEELKSLLALEARPPMIALDGLGGVGKTALAIKVAQELYEEKRYYFIVSLSAKSKIWAGHIDTRRGGFGGLHGLLSEIAAVFPDLTVTDNTSQLKREIIEFIREYPGLLVIDNLEDVSDVGVDTFLSLEVPYPSKILITSRTKKELGAITKSVPEMSPKEAALLLSSELERLGYGQGLAEEEYFQKILVASGGVPLAIKWAAQIAAERRSLISAAGVLEGAGGRKDEFLSFCLANMYEALTDIGKDVARLLPHLALEWTPLTLSIALDRPVDTIVQAMHEVSDKGITSYNEVVGYTALPLTKDFLKARWNESVKLQRVVSERFTDMFASDETSGILLDWPEERRVAFLREHARSKAEAEEFDKALKLVQLAQTWKDRDASLRFLQGEILFKMGSRAAGIGHMRQAIRLEEDGGGLTGDELTFYTNALLVEGARNAEVEALDVALTAVGRGGKLSATTLHRVIDCMLQRRDHRKVADLVARIGDDEQLAELFKKIEGLLQNNAFLIEYERQILPALKRVCGSGLLEDEVRQDYLLKIESVESSPNRQRH
jgi:hypothetical protein